MAKARFMRSSSIKSPVGSAQPIPALTTSVAPNSHTSSIVNHSSPSTSLLMPAVKRPSAGMGVSPRRQELQVEEGRDQLYRQLTIFELPDDVLLEIFDHHLFICSLKPPDTWDIHTDAWCMDAWHTLVHVCRRWRSIVFASPLRLHLQLLCTNKRPVQKTLGVWPALPIAVQGNGRMSQPQDARNIITALKQHGRVCNIKIRPIPTSLLKKIGAIVEPFPTLTSLWLSSGNKKAPILPGSFLSGSAPRLRELHLDGIPFPALPNLLLSTHDLVKLHLWDIPHSGYVSPGTMVTGLSALTRLESLRLAFRSPQSRVDQGSRGTPPLTRAVLPALTSLCFHGSSEYLDDLVSRINTPLLHDVTINFSNQLVFDTPQLRQFIGRTELFKAIHRAGISFATDFVHVLMYHWEGSASRLVLDLQISCRALDWQLSSIGQVLSLSLPPLLALEYLVIQLSGRLRQDGVENSQWLELLHPFASVKELVLSDKIPGLIAPALQELTVERVIGVLPALQSLLLNPSTRLAPIKEAIAQFVATRQLSGHPVAVVYQR